MQNSSDNNVSTGISKPMLPAGWNGIDVAPPDTTVEVIDAEGRRALAEPTYYPFKVVRNPKKTGKRSSDVVPCEPYWDGGWMVLCGLDLLSPVGTIVGWRSYPPACR